MNPQTLIQLHKQLAGARQGSADGLRATRSSADTGLRASLPGADTAEDKPSALSPQAYLVDLIDFALKKIKKEDKPITLEDLQSTFHQSFGELPVQGAAAGREVAQIRICIEVLRGYLGGRPLSAPAVEADLVKAEKDFIEAAYRGLLLRLGTSYEEIEPIADAAVDTRERLAQRLGIRISDLDKVYKPLSVLRNGLREDALETTFGLANTRGTIAPGEAEPHFLVWRNLKIQALAEGLFENGEEKEAWIKDQKNSAKEGLATAVRETEELALPALRAALIAAAGRPARELGDLLAINCAYDACFRTTRVSQAIVSLQEIIWSLRSGLLKDTHPDWKLPVGNFAESWQWLGTYESWKAAMMVFLFPENILLPSLKQEQSDPLRSIIDDLRKNRRLDRETADAYAQQYEQYFRDISGLQVEAACTTAYTDKISEPVTFQFGRKDGRLYMSNYRDNQQAFWEEIPYLQEYPIKKIISAIPLNKKTRAIYLFVGYSSFNTDKDYVPKITGDAVVGGTSSSTSESGNDSDLNAMAFGRLHVLKYDLRRQEWSDKGADLPLPMSENLNICIERVFRESDSPRIYVSAAEKNGSLHLSYFNELNTAGDGLRDENWSGIGFHNETKILGAVRVFFDITSHLLICSTPNGSDIDIWNPSRKTGANLPNHVTISGAFLGWLLIDTQKAFFLVNDNSGALAYPITVNNLGDPVKGQPLPVNGDIEFVADHFGRIVERPGSIHANIPEEKGFRIVLKIKEGSTYRTEHVFLYEKGNSLKLHQPVKILPGKIDLLDLQTVGLANRGSQVKAALEANADLFSLRYLWEAYYFLPVFLAQQLQRSMEFQDARDYYRLVYDYSLPVNDRKIFYGLSQEETPDLDEDQKSDWLSDPFNPHMLAAIRPGTYLRYTILSLAKCLLQEADIAFTRDTVESLAQARQLYTTALQLATGDDLAITADDLSLTILGFEFSIPENPSFGLLEIYAENSLFKLNSCRNIAGMERPAPLLVPATPDIGYFTIGNSTKQILPQNISNTATQFRYAFLAERAKQLVGIAQQMEAAFLSALEKFESEELNLLNAQNDLQLSKSSIRLQDLRLNEARSSVRLAALQTSRARIQKDHYQGLLSKGRNAYEQAQLGFLSASIAWQYTAAATSFVAAATPSLTSILSFGSSNADDLANGFNYLAGALQSSSELNAVLASFERTKEEWQLQRNLSNQDVRIGEQQERIALDQVAVVSQERSMADLRMEQAESIAAFLTNKFTNAELYEWMSDVLQDVYSFFLQNATATAQLAARQLAFERQEPVPAIILPDYWDTPADEKLNNGSTNDRRGLTGSARLLQDIYQLEQFALQTDRRKLQLSKTISLASLSPVEFQQFRESGQLPFYTPIELFDRDFPGHYLRLIKRIRVSVIALVPPAEGIKATLWSNGISRTVVQNNSMFSSIEIKRQPESIALNGIINASGVFEFEPGDPNRLLPFESMGVENAWELQMPKGSNLSLNYDSIADVLITIDYTALHSETYKQQVLQQLDNRVLADRAYSFRQAFPDQWYDLHHPELSAEPMQVRFSTLRSDFPANIRDLAIDQIVLYYSRAAGFEQEISEVTLAFGGKVSSHMQTVDGIISSRRGQLAELLASDHITGEWTLTLPNDPALIDAFQTDQIEDIFLVLTYKGVMP